MRFIREIQWWYQSLNGVQRATATLSVAAILLGMFTIFAPVAKSQAYGPQGSPQLPSGGASFLGDPGFCNNPTVAVTAVPNGLDSPYDGGVCADGGLLCNSCSGTCLADGGPFSGTPVPTSNLQRRSTVQVCNAGADAGDVLMCVLVGAPSILDGGPGYADSGIQTTVGYTNNCLVDGGLDLPACYNDGGFLPIAPFDTPYDAGVCADGGTSCNFCSGSCLADGGPQYMLYNPYDGGPYDAGIQTPVDCPYTAYYSGSGETYTADGGPCDGGILWVLGQTLDGGPTWTCQPGLDGGPGLFDAGPGSACHQDAGILVTSTWLDLPYDAGYKGTPSQGQTLTQGQCLPYSAGSGAQIECQGNDPVAIPANTLECQ